jgi:putative tryptophan/tyrosine transport system substrate-binding protein
LVRFRVVAGTLASTVFVVSPSAPVGDTHDLLSTPRRLPSAQRQQIVSLAARHCLVAVYESRDFVQAGSLMSYGPDYRDVYRRAAGIVHKILRGTKPADLPVEQPTKYEFVINLKTAKALGLDVSLELQQLADDVIE